MKTEQEIRDRLVLDQEQLQKYSRGSYPENNNLICEIQTALEERSSLMHWILEEIR